MIAEFPYPNLNAQGLETPPSALLFEFRIPSPVGVHEDLQAAQPTS